MWWSEDTSACFVWFWDYRSQTMALMIWTQSNFDMMLNEIFGAMTFSADNWTNHSGPNWNHFTALSALKLLFYNSFHFLSMCSMTDQTNRQLINMKFGHISKKENRRVKFFNGMKWTHAQERATFLLCLKLRNNENLEGVRPIGDFIRPILSFIALRHKEREGVFTFLEVYVCICWKYIARKYISISKMKCVIIKNYLE